MSDIGDLIEGRYRVERSVGSGGMGIVYQATDLVTQRCVAVKVLSASVDPSVAAQARLEREIELLSRLDSPHVAKFLSAGYLEDGLPYFVMEFLEGRDLKAELRRRGPLPCGEAAAYIVQASRGIAVAHRLGIVHRDLKPHNLFVTGLDGIRKVKVVDFGVAKSLNASDPGLTATDAAVGTPLYMSPEQLIDARATSTKADIWALGVILYELLAGFSPFADNSPGAVIAAVTLDDPVPIQKLRPDVPDEMAKAIDLALTKLPTDRIGTADELAQLLLSCATPDHLLIVPPEVELQTHAAIERLPRARVSAYLREQILAAIDADAPQERATMRCLPTASTQGSRPLPERLSLVPALRSLTPELPELIGKLTASRPAPKKEVAQHRWINAPSKTLAVILLAAAVPVIVLAYWHSAGVTKPEAPPSQPSASPAQSIVETLIPKEVEQTPASVESLKLEPAGSSANRVAVSEPEPLSKKARSTRPTTMVTPAAATPVTPPPTTTAKVPRHL